MGKKWEFVSEQRLEFIGKTLLDRTILLFHCCHRADKAVAFRSKIESWNLENNVGFLQGKAKPELNPAAKTSDQGWEPTTNSTTIIPPLNPSHSWWEVEHSHH